MSQSKEDTEKALTVRSEERDYEVGYSKPPKETRFKSGRSGNPNGRPRGSKNKKPPLGTERLKEIILEEAYRTIKINDGAKQVDVPMAQAVVRSLAHNAVKGNARAQQLFSEMLATTEKQNHTELMELFGSAIDYKQHWYAELARRKQLGIDGPDPIPHPDHVVVNARDGTVRFTGPMTEEEKVVWDEMLARREQYMQEIEEFRKDLKDPEMAEYKAQIEYEIRHNERIINIIDSNLGTKDR
ncbi:MAG: DUF5681 domain-containing protein [Rhizobiaceae bacterium]